MDTELLDTFVHISRTRSFTKTAQAMYLTQAAVSARIKQLESLVGHPVFIRCKNNHTVRLTKAGFALLPFASDFINNWALIRKEINNIQDSPTLNIGVYPCLISYLFEKIMTLCDTERFRLNINQCHSPGFTESVCDYDVDLFITLIKPGLSQYEYAHLGIHKIGLLYNNLIDGPAIFVNWGNDINKKISALLQTGYSLKTDSPDYANNYILKHGGKSYLPLDMKMKQIKQDFNYPVIDVPVYALFDKKKMNPAIESFIDIISA